MLVMIISGLVGAVLGRRYKVLSLVPTALVGLGVLGLVGAASDASGWWLAESAVVLILTLQAGYVAGTGASHVLVLARVRSFRMARQARSGSVGDRHREAGSPLQGAGSPANRV